VDLSQYTPFHTGICRPIGLSQDEIAKVVNFVVARLGYKYDLRNIKVIVRLIYLFPSPKHNGGCHGK
jgi:hypothetical protein